MQSLREEVQHPTPAGHPHQDAHKWETLHLWSVRLRFQVRDVKINLCWKLHTGYFADQMEFLDGINKLTARSLFLHVQFVGKNSAQGMRQRCTSDPTLGKNEWSVMFVDAALLTKLRSTSTDCDTKSSVYRALSVTYHFQQREDSRGILRKSILWQLFGLFRSTRQWETLNMLRWLCQMKN